MEHEFIPVRAESIDNRTWPDGVHGLIVSGKTNRANRPQVTSEVTVFVDSDELLTALEAAVARMRQSWEARR